jgi:1-acyl-sn-glycerol-3-phosphate acyltransferase
MLYALTWPLMKRFLRFIFVLTGGFRVHGRENVPKKGGVLICPNHVCDADPPAVAAALPRGAWFMAKDDIFDIPVLGALTRLWHGFPVKRNTADRAALRRAEDLLKAGEAVVIFPEGGGNEQATLQPLNPGALMIALRTGVPVVPVALTNTHKVWPYGRVRPSRAGVPVGVTFGPPLDLSDLAGKRGAVEAATQRLTETLAAMLGQAVPAGKPRRRDAEPPPCAPNAESAAAA